MVVHVVVATARGGGAPAPPVVVRDRPALMCARVWRSSRDACTDRVCNVIRPGQGGGEPHLSFQGACSNAPMERGITAAELTMLGDRRHGARTAGICSDCARLACRANHEFVFGF